VRNRRGRHSRLHDLERGAVTRQRGGLHPFTLPEDAQLQSVTINGQTQPIRQEGRAVSIPLVPGSQSIQLVWRQTSGLPTSWTTPALGLGFSTVNAELQVRMPSDRWVLFVTGPRMGPAVLFCSFLLVLLVVSVGLGRSRYAPVKTYQWVLLALGLSQLPIIAIAMVFGWLLLVAWRERVTVDGVASFNVRQLVLVGATGIALIDDGEFHLRRCLAHLVRDVSCDVLSIATNQTEVRPRCGSFKYTVLCSLVRWPSFPVSAARGMTPTPARA